MAGHSHPPLGAQSAEIKRLRRLVSKRAEREALGRCVVEGVRGIEAVLASPADIECIYSAPGVGDDARLGAVLDAARARGTKVVAVADGVIERVAGTVTPQPVLAVVTTPKLSLAEVDLTRPVVVLAGVADPGNAGTIVRTAQAAGAAAVVFCARSTEAFSPKTVRASAGAVFHVPVIQGGPPHEVLETLHERGVRCVGTVAGGGTRYDLADWTPPFALVLGGEAFGVPSDAASRIDEWVSIPMEGQAESLNVAMAATVLMFEAARRQWATDS